MLALSPLALASTVGCALALAGADYFRKAVPETVPTAALLFYFLAGQLPLLAAWYGLTPGSPNVGTLTAAYWRPGLADAAASLVGNTLFIVAVRRSPIGAVVPLLSLIPVFTVAFAALILQEWPSPRQSAGIIVTAVGVFLIYQPVGVGFNPKTVWRNFRKEPGATPMVCVALAWALTAPLDKIALAEAGVGLHALIQVGLLTAAAGLWLVLTKQSFRVPANARFTVAGASLAAGLSYGLQLAAYQLTLVAFVEALKRSIEIVAVLVVGAWVLNERYNRNKIAGIALIVCGVPLMIAPEIVIPGMP